MEQISFWKFLRTKEAAYAYLTTLGLIALFAFDHWYHRDVRNYDSRLFYFVTSSPITLWAMWRIQAKVIKREMSNQHAAKNASEKFRADQVEKRTASLFFSALFAVLLIIFGTRMEVSSSSQILYSGSFLFGMLLLGMAVLGMLGFNIWRGGPLDPRKDPPSTTNEEE